MQNHNLKDFYYAFKESDDIFDFLDNVNKYKVLQGGINSDIVDIVNLYLDFFNENKDTMSRVSFDDKACKSNKGNRLSTMSTLSKPYEWQNEDYFEAYEERAGIYQYDAGLNQLEAKKKAFKEISKDFLGQYSLNENSNEFKSFLAGFNNYINKTIQ